MTRTHPPDITLRPDGPIQETVGFSAAMARPGPARMNGAYRMTLVARQGDWQGTVPAYGPAQDAPEAPR
jgi:hypothetical protein